MKKLIALLPLFAVCALSINLYAQSATTGKESETALDTKGLAAESADLDKQILDLSKKIAEAVVKYGLYNAKDVPATPYQISFESKDGYIMLTRYSIIKDTFNKGIAGRREKVIKIYTNGSSVTKIESVIQERDTSKSSDNKITIVDPSPLAEGTSDIVFTHTYNGRALIDAKPLKDIKNTTAFPIANNLKRDFYIPHLQYFYSNIVSIGESYQKGIKDNETIMEDILKKSTSY